MTIKLIASNVGRLQELDFITGIQRVTLELHKAIFQNIDKSRHEFKAYSRTNINFDSTYDINPVFKKDPILKGIRANLDDISVLLLFDLDDKIEHTKILEAKVKNDLKVITNVYDLLPLSNPEWFPLKNSKQLFASWLMKIITVSDHLIFNSESTLQKFRELEWNCTAEFHVFPLGALEVTSAPSFFVLPQKTIICVSTLEPRKGHDDLLDAYDLLLKENQDFRLMFVGRYGWKSEALVHRIYNHPEYGKRFRWYEKIDDDELVALYNSATICVMPSFGEGFGLAIEEALTFGIPVIAREIPVFMERDYLNLTFFKGGAKQLAEQIVKVSEGVNIFPESKVRKMSDFGVQVLSLIESLP